MSVSRKKHNSLIFEELEPRLLFSADGAEALAAVAVEQEMQEQPVIIITAESPDQLENVAGDQPDEEEINSFSASETAVESTSAGDEGEGESAGSNSAADESGDGTEQPSSSDETEVIDAGLAVSGEDAAYELTESSEITELVFVNDNVLDHERLVDEIEKSNSSERIL